MAEVTFIDIEIGLKSGTEKNFTVQVDRDEFKQDGPIVLVKVEESPKCTRVFQTTSENVEYIEQLIRTVEQEKKPVWEDERERL